MKKFMKNCGITALVCIILGLVMAIVAGGIQGTAIISDTVEEMTNGYVHLNLNGIGDFGITIGDKIWDEIITSENNVFFELEENMDYDIEAGIQSGDIDKFSLGNDVTRMDIEVGGCKLNIKESDDDNFYVKAENVHKFQSFVRNGKLYVKEFTSKKIWDEVMGSSIIVYVPEGYYFEEVEIKLGAGELNLGELHTDELSLAVGAGRITGEYVEASDAEIAVGAGNIEIDDMQVDKLKVEVGMGNLDLAANIEKSARMECAMGAIDLTVKGSNTDFDYSVEVAMGDITIGEKSYSGLARKKNIDNKADKTMDVECAMGSINIDFEE